MKRIVLLGDSLIQCSTGTTLMFQDPSLKVSKCQPGFADALSEVYSRRCDVLNRGFAGYNTSNFLKFIWKDLLENELSDNNVELSVILFGANDSADENKNLVQQHVPVETFEANLTKIITQLQSKSARIILCTPPPVDRKKYLAWRMNTHLFPLHAGLTEAQVEDRSNALVTPYVEACRRVAIKQGVALCDLFATFAKQENMPDLLVDGLHFTGEGESLVFKSLMGVIQANFPEMVVEKDPITKSWSNSGSKCAALKIQPPCWDLLEEATDLSQEISHVCFPSSRKYALLIGDSITQQAVGSPMFASSHLPGWGDMLNCYFSRRLDVINRGMSGYNTAWAMRTRFAVPSTSCELVTIFFGANDACVNSKQFVSLKEYESNIKGLIGFAVKKLKAKHVICISPPPICLEVYLRFRKLRPMNAGKTDEELMDRSNEIVQQYVNVCEKVCKEMKGEVLFLNLYSIMMQQQPPQLNELLFDGLHLSGKGNVLLGEEILRLISSRCSSLLVEPNPAFVQFGLIGSKSPLEQQGPWFQDIPKLNPKEQDDDVKRSKRSNV